MNVRQCHRSFHSQRFREWMRTIPVAMSLAVRLVIVAGALAFGSEEVRVVDGGMCVANNLGLCF